MMIGGETEVVQRLNPIFTTLAPGRGDVFRTVAREELGGTAEQGYLHCGPSGARHFVKMVHNGDVAKTPKRPRPPTKIHGSNDFLF
jgi:6-phosphogluconate dehydrogenase